MKYLYLVLVLSLTGCLGNNNSGGEMREANETIKSLNAKTMESMMSPTISITINAEKGFVHSDAVEHLIHSLGNLPQNKINMAGNSRISADMSEKVASWYKSQNPFSLILYGVGIILIGFGLKKYFFDAKKLIKSGQKIAGRLLKTLDEGMKEKKAQVTSLETSLHFAPEEKHELIKAKISGLMDGIKENETAIQRHHNKK